MRTDDILDDHIAEVDTNFIAQVDSFVSGWIGEPLV
jgi:hypothetical protein